MSEKQSPAVASTTQPGRECALPNQSTSRTPKKWCRVLAALVRGERLHRFEAEKLYHDHTLPSTVSELQRKGVKIARRDECVPGYAGQPAYVTRYWLDPTEAENLARARALLSDEARGAR